MRIVTFCAHQPFLYLFARMGVDMDVVQLEGQRRFLQNWRDSVRPLPPRWRLLDWDAAKRNLAAGRYRLSLAHNLSDYIDFMPFKTPRVMVVHTTLSGRVAEEKTAVDPNAYKRDFYRLIKKTGGVLTFVSEHKRKDWGLPGAVIPLPVDCEDYCGYTGERAEILRVANQLVERGDILGYDAHQTLTADLPTTLVGHNPRIESARPAESWDELKAFYRTRRVYLHTAAAGMEDGYNTAMLEAMATGMPVVCAAHPTSPIVDGRNGFIADDLTYLRAKLELLLADRDLARTLGSAARQTVMARFSIDAFHRRWREVFHKAARKA